MYWVYAFNIRTPPEIREREFKGQRLRGDNAKVCIKKELVYTLTLDLCTFLLLVTSCVPISIRIYLAHEKMYYEI